MFYIFSQADGVPHPLPRSHPAVQCRDGFPRLPSCRPVPSRIPTPRPNSPQPLLHPRLASLASRHTRVPAHPDPELALSAVVGAGMCRPLIHPHPASPIAQNCSWRCPLIRIVGGRGSPIFSSRIPMPRPNSPSPLLHPHLPCPVASRHLRPAAHPARARACGRGCRGDHGATRHSLHTPLHPLPKQLVAVPAHQDRRASGVGGGVSGWQWEGRRSVGPCPVHFAGVDHPSAAGACTPAHPEGRWVGRWKLPPRFSLPAP
jgi:hypothetical protein